VPSQYTEDAVLAAYFKDTPASLAKCPDEYLVELGYRLHATTIGNRLFEARP